jgi:DNA-binding MarR family transcriptional regulator
MARKKTTKKTTKKTAKKMALRKGKSAGGKAVVRFGRLAGWVGFNLRMAQESAFEAFSHLSREIGESPGRFATLTLIAENPGISQSTLGRAAGRDKSSMTPVLDDLVRRGLVSRARAAEDRRTYRLNLTAAGAKTLARLTACARRHEQNLDRIIGLRERARFLRTLKRVQAIS